MNALASLKGNPAARWGAIAELKSVVTSNQRARRPERVLGSSAKRTQATPSRTNSSIASTCRLDERAPLSSLALIARTPKSGNASHSRQPSVRVAVGRVGGSAETASMDTAPAPRTGAGTFARAAAGVKSRRD